MKSYEAIKLIKVKAPGIIKIKRIRVQHLKKIRDRLMKVNIHAPRKTNMKSLGMKHDAFGRFSTLYGLKFNTWKKKIILEKWNPKLTLTENALLFGFSYNCAMFWATRLHLKYEFQRQAKINRIDRKIVADFLIKNGFTLEAIGRLYGVTRERARQYALGR